MEQELPKPLVSDDQIIQEEEAWNGSIDGGLKEKLASTYTARWVRDIYESELQRLRAQVKAMVDDIKVIAAENAHKCYTNRIEQMTPPAPVAFHIDNYMWKKHGIKL
ncbi:MAG TPA: hypothetical protein PLZ24_15650 [Flavobacteriales bacterium]|nr:hypothetical protein [Flavobacteriales bacterium]